MSRRTNPEATATKAKGRPPGAKQLKAPETAGELTRCPACGSTNRDPYLTKDVQVYAGIDLVTGKPYTAIVRRRCRCTDCGQHRIDRHLVNEPRRRK